MSVAQYRNALRQRAVAISRAFKILFGGAVAPGRTWWRGLFLGDDGTLRRSGEIALADLRDFCFATKSTFDPDALVMARREGRRDVWMRVTRYLNLDEAQVQTLMEIDDGIE